MTLIPEDWEYFTPDHEIEEALADKEDLPLRFRDLLNRRSDEKPGYSIIKRKKHRQHDPGNRFALPACFQDMLEAMLRRVPSKQRDDYLRERFLQALTCLPSQDLHCLMANLLGIRSEKRKILFNERYLRKAIASFLDAILVDECKPSCLCGCGQPVAITESLYKQGMRSRTLPAQVSEQCTRRKKR